MSKKLAEIGLSLFEFSMILIVASAIVRLASSLYLPSLIDMGKSLHMSESTLGYTLVIFFVSYSVATLFVGPLVDYYGRKEMIIAGSVVFILGSLLCSVSVSHLMLFGGRILQAAGAAAIPVSSRAMIRDYCDDIEVIKVLGWLAGIGGIIPILAPALGGIVTQDFGWRYNFYLLVILALAALVYAYKKLPKSLKKTSSIHFSDILKNYSNIIVSPRFYIVIFPLALAFAMQGVFLVSTPFIFMKTYGLTPFEYGLTNIIIASALLVGRYIAVFVVERYTNKTAYVLGSVLTFLGGIVIAGLMLFGMLNMVLLLISLFISVAGFGTILPVGIKTIMTTFSKQAGMVSALHGFITLAFMAGGSYVFSLFRDHFQMSYIFILGASIVVLGAMMSMVTIFTTKIILNSE